MSYNTGQDDVLVLSPGEFIARFATEWQIGEHMSLIGPTGTGKSTFTGLTFRLRKYILAIDPKGGDPTIAALGWPRLSSWPGRDKMERMVAKNDENGLPSRYIVGEIVRERAQLPHLRQTIAQAISDAFDMGGWTLYIDELQIVVDRRMMNLSRPVAQALVSARSSALTVMSAFQSPRWVISEALVQPTWLATTYTRDVETVNRMAEVMGRNRAEFRGVVKALANPTHLWVVVGRNPRAPYMIVRPPRLTRSPR